MRGWSGSLAAVTVLLSMAVAGPSAEAADGPVIGADGMTAPVFDYKDATRQRAYIPVPGVDQDADGVTDRVVADVLRPTSENPTTRFPAIIDPSPYFTTVCRGNEVQCIGDVDGDGLNDKWPLFYDNWFVPRGYAYVLAHADGTGASTGCPLHGGPGDVAGQRAIVDWLNGRLPGYTTSTGDVPVDAGWHNGSSAMIGKSYDGTFANGTAATGVAGLKTIVPISAISDWYKYSRQNGLRFNTDYPAGLSGNVTNPDRRDLCRPSRDRMSLDDGDETGDVNPFWDQRNYQLSVGRVKAAVFAAHGLQDDNVKMDHLSEWWQALGEQGVPRKLWLLREGHVDPFESRRGEWVRTLNRWFDHWLYGVDNGIMDEPAVDIEDSADRWSTAATWPVPGTDDTDVYLRGTQAAKAGALGLGPGGALDSVRFTNAPTQTEQQVIDSPTGAQTARRVFLSPPLKTDLRLSGTPRVSLKATLDTDQTNLAAVLIDYGGGEQIARSPGDGVQNTTNRTCWGSSPANDVDFSACYLEVTKRVGIVSSWRVTRGVLDSSNRSSVRVPEDVVPGVATTLNWPLVPTDHVFRKGHQIAVAIVGDYPTLTRAQLSRNPGTNVAVDVKASKVTLPLVGGYDAALASGAFAPDTVAPALNVPADLTVAADGDGAVVDYAAPAATDDTDPAPEVACDPGSGTRFPMGATTVTCVARDSAGNAREASFRVTVSPTATGTAPGGELPAPAAPAAPETRTPVSPAPVDGAAQPTPAESPTLDRVPLRLRGVAVSQRGRRPAVRFDLDRSARVTVTIRRVGSRRTLRTTARRLRAGRPTVRFGRLTLARGRYAITVAARDDAGDRTTVTRTLRVRR